MLPNKTKIKAILLKRGLLGRIIFKAFFTIDKIRFLHHQIDHKINFISETLQFSWIELFTDRLIVYNGLTPLS